MNIKGVPTGLSYYSHIEKLSINCSISRKQILSIVDLKQVKYLSILSMTDLLKFQADEFIMPNLCELKIIQVVTSIIIQDFKDKQFKQIRKLFIAVDPNNRSFILKGLFYCFPHIEYLTHLGEIDSMKMFVDVIDGFVYLLNVSFYYVNLRHEIISDLYSNPNHIIQNSHRLNENNFTCRARQLYSSLYGVLWWIEPQVSLYQTIKILFMTIFLILCSHYNHL